MFLCSVVFGFALLFRLAAAYNSTWKFEDLNLNCSYSSHVIQNQSDFDQLDTCYTSEYGQVLVGDVTISSKFEGSLNISAIDSINGSIYAAYSDEFTGLISTSLTYVYGIELRYLPKFSTFQMDSLSYFWTLTVVALPLLESIDLSPDVTFQGIGDISIVNSGLSSFTGLDDFDVWTSSLDFSNNTNLEKLDLSGVRYPNGTNYAITIIGGSSGVDVDLSGLEYVATLSLENVSGLSVPHLLEVYDDLLIANTTTESISMANLKHVDRSMIIAYNSKLQAISFPVLLEVSNLKIHDNTILQVDDSSFLRLADAEDIIIHTSLSGNILPELNILWELYLYTQNTNFSCRHMDKRVRKKKITTGDTFKVSYSCQVLNASGKDVSKHWHPPKLSHEGKVAIIIVCSAVGAMILFFVLYLANRRLAEDERLRAQDQLQDHDEELPQYSENDPPPKYEAPSVHSMAVESSNNRDIGNDNEHERSVGSTNNVAVHA